MWPGFDTRCQCHTCHTWVVFVVGSRPCSEGFLRVLRFSSLHKNQHFQIPIRPGRQISLHMSPWFGRLGDYSLHYDVKFDLPITDFLTSYIRPMCSCWNKRVCSKLPITLATATTIAHLYLPQLTVTHRGLYTHLVL